jgi:hypothetical protein
LSASSLLEKLHNVETTLARHEEKDKIKAMLDWVSTTLVSLDHADVKNKLYPKYVKSGQWLLDSTDFKSWKNSPSGHFWLQGTIGTGKSCLAWTVIEHLRQENKSLAFFYYNAKLRREIEKKEVERKELGKEKKGASYWNTTILGALARQLAESPDQDDVALEVRHRYDKATKEDRDPPPLAEKELPELLDKLVASRNSELETTILVIDGLDECAEYIELLSTLKLLGEKRKVKFFLSSQFVVPVDRYFPVTKLAISSDINSSDIEGFVKGEVEDFELNRPKVLGDALSKDIIKTLTKYSSGM